MDKFDQLNTDADTRILKQQFIRIGEFDARQENWLWDGIMGKSIIFVSAEVAHLSDDDIWQRVADHLSLDSASRGRHRKRKLKHAKIFSVRPMI